MPTTPPMPPTQRIVVEDARFLQRINAIPTTPPMPPMEVADARF